MKKPQKITYPSYSTREALDGFKHEALSRRGKLTPEMITAVSGAMSKLIEDECNLIRAKADARLNLITAKTGEKMLKGE